MRCAAVRRSGQASTVSLMVVRELHSLSRAVIAVLLTSGSQSRDTWPATQYRRCGTLPGIFRGSGRMCGRTELKEHRCECQRRGCSGIPGL